MFEPLCGGFRCAVVSTTRTCGRDEAAPRRAAASDGAGVKSHPLCAKRQAQALRRSGLRLLRLPLPRTVTRTVSVRVEIRRKGNMAPLQFLTNLNHVCEQCVTPAQCVCVYTFDDEWPPASTHPPARNIDDHRELLAAYEGIYLELNVAVMWRKGTSKRPSVVWFAPIARDRIDRAVPAC